MGIFGPKGMTTAKAVDEYIRRECKFVEQKVRLETADEIKRLREWIAQLNSCTESTASSQRRIDSLTEENQQLDAARANSFRRYEDSRREIRSIAASLADCRRGLSDLIDANKSLKKDADGIKLLREQIEELKKQLVFCGQETRDAEEKVAALEACLASGRGELRRLRNEIVDLKKRTEVSHSVGFLTLLGKSTDLEKENQKLRKEIHSLREKIRSCDVPGFLALSKKVSGLEKDNEVLAEQGQRDYGDLVVCQNTRNLLATDNEELRMKLKALWDILAYKEENS